MIINMVPYKDKTTKVRDFSYRTDHYKGIAMA
jgi:hypothetical protein